jgi:hypothetical protein
MDNPEQPTVLAEKTTPCVLSKMPSDDVSHKSPITHSVDVDPKDKAVSEESASEAPPCCGANLRWGGICKNPPVSGKRRCSIHGNAPGSGAPLGNKNAFKHGCFTREWREEGKRIRREARDLAKRRAALRARRRGK